MTPHYHASRVLKQTVVRPPFIRLLIAFACLLAMASCTDRSGEERLAESTDAATTSADTSARGTTTDSAAPGLEAHQEPDPVEAFRIVTSNGGRLFKVKGVDSTSVNDKLEIEPMGGGCVDDSLTLQASIVNTSNAPMTAVEIQATIDGTNGAPPQTIPIGNVAPNEHRSLVIPVGALQLQPGGHKLVLRLRGNHNGPFADAGDDMKFCTQ